MHGACECARREQQQRKTVKDYVEWMSIVNLLANCIRAQLCCSVVHAARYSFHFLPSFTEKNETQKKVHIDVVAGVGCIE